jgi:methionyl-tRNA formyltransferase
MDKKIGILCTIDAPLLTHNIKALLDDGYKNIYLIADLKGFGAENSVRWQERTNGFFESSTLSLGYFVQYKVPVFFADNHNARTCISLISSLKIDLLLNVGTPRKLSKVFLDSVGCDVLNVHPGILPNYRGACCVEWAILSDDPIGNTAHFMVEDYDAGPIIAIEQYQFQIGSSYMDIRNKIYHESIRLMVESVGLIFRGGVRSCNMEEQDVDIKPYRPISSEDMLIVREKIATNGHHAICLL